MNKENTFNLLKKLPFEKIYEEYINYPGYTPYKWFEERGWTWGEFRNERHKRYGK